MTSLNEPEQFSKINRRDDTNDQTCSLDLNSLDGATITMTPNYHPDLSRPNSSTSCAPPFHVTDTNFTSPPPNSSQFNSQNECQCLPASSCGEDGVSWSRGGRIYFILYKLKKYFIIYPALTFGMWALIYLLCGKDQAMPGGGFFGVFVLLLVTNFLGHMMDWIGLPPLIGMLLAGLIHGNVPNFTDMAPIPPTLLSPLRGIASAMLITRGAYNVNPDAIKKYPLVVPLLAYLSCATGALVAGAGIYFIVNLPLTWSALLGATIAAMAGPVVMPFLKRFDATKYQENQTALAIAKGACGLDAILSIVAAECALGFIFSNGEILDSFQKGLAEVLLGAAFGVVWGSLIATFLDQRNSIEMKTFAVFSCALMSQLGLYEIGYLRAGPPGVFVGALVSNLIWRQKDPTSHAKVDENLTKIWLLFQPLLFGILGSRTDLDTVDWSVMTKMVACLTISLSARILMAYMVCGLEKGMTWGERLFVAIALVPKGTLQAELAPVALDMARKLKFGPEAEALGYQAMSISVLTILLTSFIGTLLLLILGPRLLRRKQA